ncbi:MAG: sugar glycosyltransferase [Rouxiella aceris]|uniref:sugar glycosyltransferase n=1 Tax=Rouxiella aceris TaxID=2703884 RepID=UPI002840D061|nr:sugar glycosyltransferase [Rouxiella aceris]MDR3432845.1 sugar glycosyltransferase [Rouxiella aceris]
MGSFFKQLYRYTHKRPFRHNENLWPYMRISRASSGEIVSLNFRGQTVPIVDLSSLAAVHSGPIMLTATGPSVKNIRFKTPASFPAMGVNGAWSLGNVVDFKFYVIVDMGFFDQRPEMIAEIVADPQLTLFTTAHGIARIIDRLSLARIRCRLALIEDAAFKIFQPKIPASELGRCYANVRSASFAENRPDIGFTTDIRHGIFDAGTVAYWALQIAAYLGFSEMYIIGLDMNNFSQPRFYESENDKLPTYLAENLEDLIVPAFTHASQVLKKKQIRVVNLSMHSAISSQIFEKADYHQVFG